MKNLTPFRIHTLVPAVKKDRSCIHLDNSGHCDIHQIAPFGCAFFDCTSGPESYILSSRALKLIYQEWLNNGLYRQIWEHLDRNGLRQFAPEELKELHK